MTINIFLFIGILMAVSCFGVFTACLLGASKVSGLEEDKVYWKQQYSDTDKQLKLERDSHKGTEKRYIELVQKVKDAEHNGFLRGMERAREITDKVFKETK